MVCLLVGRKTKLSGARSRVVWTRLYHHTLLHHIHSRFRLYSNRAGVRDISALMVLQALSFKSCPDRRHDLFGRPRFCNMHARARLAAEFQTHRATECGLPSCRRPFPLPTPINVFITFPGMPNENIRTLSWPLCYSNDHRDAADGDQGALRAFGEFPVFLPIDDDTHGAVIRAAHGVRAARTLPHTDPRDGRAVDPEEHGRVRHGNAEQGEEERARGRARLGDTSQSRAKDQRQRYSSGVRTVSVD